MDKCRVGLREQRRKWNEGVCKMFSFCIFKNAFSKPILSSSLNRNNFATLTGIASALVNGFTYSYLFKESRNGKKCCRPIKSKCLFEEKKGGNVCKTTTGRIKCGRGCFLIVKAVKKMEKKSKEKTPFHSE